VLGPIVLFSHGARAIPPRALFADDDESH
jgi:hypothetical protein